MHIKCLPFEIALLPVEKLHAFFTQNKSRTILIFQEIPIQRQFYEIIREQLSKDKLGRIKI